MARLYGPTDAARRVEETDPSLHYSPFRRDYARLVHSPAFRRLQGKTQLFPGFESDFFRNRLTHSIEVAQVAKAIAFHLNSKEPELADDPIDPDIVEFAALAHDLGHPPFGHNGETALDECMKKYGGFEGNAQTLRILSRLEKKRLLYEATADSKDVGVAPDQTDFRAGLNISARSLAAVLKYDFEIPASRGPGENVFKGYYRSESEIVRWARRNVMSESASSRPLKTVECQIMDVADDIAYSTYDLEDAFKAGFLTPLELLSLDDALREGVAQRVASRLGKPFTATDVLDVLIETFSGILDGGADSESSPLLPMLAYQRSSSIASIGYARTELTSELVGQFISGVEFKYDSICPPLSQVSLEANTLRRVETLKHLTYEAVIQSPRLKVAEFRGLEIVSTIFEALANKRGQHLLPADFQQLYRRTGGDEGRLRVICDFIAGMTDSYAIDFYARLKSENARTIFKPF